MADNTKFVQAQDFKLSGGGVTSTATTINLASFKLPDGSTNITMSDFGDVGHGVLEPGTSREEIVTFTGVTQNGDGTATLTGVTRGVNFVDPYDEQSAYKQTHSGNALFRISNTSKFYSEFALKDNDESITGLWTFDDANRPLLDADADATADAQLITKGELNRTALGTTTVDRVIVSATAGATIAAGNLVYLDNADTEWKLVDATDTATLYNVKLGIAQGAGTDGNSIVGGVLTQGLDSNQSGLSTNSTAYATDTPGAIGTSVGTNEKIVGDVISATEVLFDPDYGPAPTADEKDALAGTNGSPSSTNKYVTNDDTATTSTANEIPRGDGSGKIDDDWLTTDAQSKVRKVFTAGVALTAGEAVIIGNGETTNTITQTTDDSTHTDMTNTKWYGQTFTTQGAAETVDAIQLSLRNANAGDRTVRVSIRATSGGLPTGADLDTKDILLSGSEVGFTTRTFTFDTPIAVSPSTVYAIVVQNITDATGVYIKYNSTNLYSGGNAVSSTDSGSSWSSDAPNDLHFVVTETQTESGKVYPTSAAVTSILSDGFIGFVDANATADNDVTVSVNGVDDNQSGLTVGDTYFLQDSSGTIGTSAGSVSRKVGLAVSATEILIKQDNV